MVIDGETVLLARTPNEWCAAISHLAHDPELRRRMCRAVREMVETHYSVDRWSPTLAFLIDQLSRQDIVPDLSQPRLAAPSQNPPQMEELATAARSSSL